MSDDFDVTYCEGCGDPVADGNRADRNGFALCAACEVEAVKYEREILEMENQGA